MGRGVIACLLAALLISGGAEAQGAVGGRVFECDLLWKGKLRDDGSMGPTDWTKLHMKAFPTFLFDEGSAVLRWKASDLAWQYRVVQAGTEDNSLLAIRTMQGTASFVVDSLRIQTFVKGWPFLLIEQDEISTGKCRRL